MHVVLFFFIQNNNLESIQILSYFWSGGVAVPKILHAKVGLSFLRNAVNQVDQVKFPTTAQTNIEVNTTVHVMSATGSI